MGRALRTRNVLQRKVRNLSSCWLTPAVVCVGGLTVLVASAGAQRLPPADSRAGAERGRHAAPAPPAQRGVLHVRPGGSRLDGDPRREGGGRRCRGGSAGPRGSAADARVR